MTYQGHTHSSDVTVLLSYVGIPYHVVKQTIRGLQAMQKPEPELLHHCKTAAEAAVPPASVRVMDRNQVQIKSSLQRQCLLRGQIKPTKKFNSPGKRLSLKQKFRNFHLGTSVRMDGVNVQ